MRVVLHEHPAREGIRQRPPHSRDASQLLHDPLTDPRPFSKLPEDLKATSKPADSPTVMDSKPAPVTTASLAVKESTPGVDSKPVVAEASVHAAPQNVLTKAADKLRGLFHHDETVASSAPKGPTMAHVPGAHVGGDRARWHNVRDWRRQFQRRTGNEHGPSVRSD